MTTIRQIVTDAFREAGIVAVGDTPEADSLDEGVNRLNTLYRSLFSNELGEPLTAINYGKAGLDNAYAKDEDVSSIIDATYVPSNTRLMLNLDEAKTLYLPPNPQDGARVAVIDNGGNLATYNITLNANGRQIELTDTVVLSTNSLNREWFYRADLGNWVRVLDLDVDAQSPLPVEFDDFLVTLLAFRLNPRYGAETSQEMVEVLKRLRRIFRARYRQTHEQESEAALYRLPSQRFWFNYFNIGRPR